MLDEAGFPDAKFSHQMILMKKRLSHLSKEGAKITAWGIGTKLITAFDQPALGAVYKLVAIENKAGQLEDRIKISNNAEK